MPARVLACLAPEVRAQLRAAVAGGHVLFADDIEDALHALTHLDFDMVLIGMRFDESRGLELMQRVSANTTFARMPVVGVRDAPVRPGTLQAFDVPMRTLGAQEIVDLGVVPGLLRGLSPS